MGAQRLGEVMDELEVLVGEQGTADEAALHQELLDVVHALVGEGDPLVLLLQLVVPCRLRVSLGIGARVGVFLALHHLLDELVHLRKLEGIVLRHPGDDQRGARLVDEDVVDLVDNGVGVTSLHLLRRAPAHVVSQVVEAEFVVRSVGDVF